MRICHVTSAHPAGDTRIAHKEALSALLAGHQVTLVAPDKGTSPPPALTFVPISVRTGRLNRMVVGAASAISKARHQRADIYQLHDPELLPWIPLLRLAGARVIYDMHEDLPGQVRSKHWIPSPLRRPTAWLSALLVRGCTVFASAVVHARPDTYATGCHRLDVLVENYPKLGEFPTTSAPRLPNANAQFTLAYVGALSRIRGAAPLVDALELACTSQPIKLLLAGTFAPQALEADLMSRPGWSAVDFRGVLGRAEVADLLGRADAGIVTFLPEPNHVHACPTKLFEYMAAGLPVIASDIPLWRSIIEDANCGILVDPTSPGDIARGILQLAADTDRLPALGAGGRKAVEERYNWEAEYAKLEALYQRLAPTRSQAPTGHPAA